MKERTLSALLVLTASLLLFYFVFAKTDTVQQEVSVEGEPSQPRYLEVNKTQLDEASKIDDLNIEVEDGGRDLTTNTGVTVSDDQNSLKAGIRGPTLMEDFHFREKMTHFDHERIPERIVHARGAAAHGYFQVYEDFSEFSKASLFKDPSKKTPVFVRFSTVAGSRGSADTPRDVRGFATKFYTDEGIWDLVGNNMPVFFIQDAIKFPDLIHAAKPEPDTEIPQAQTAHDTFWDFVSLTPESTHMLMWTMSDRAIPRSYSTMEGFGVHTFRLVNETGYSRFVKFHWKPVKGIHSLVWDEAQKIAGKDPDFNRRDLYESIQKGLYPEYELGVQIVEEKDEFSFNFDLLDATKIIPEELVPVRKIGKMVLNKNPDNFFAEVEQVAFHTAHVVPGIDFTNDPLLQGRLFSYLDTQLRRVGPNFQELPINRPLNPVHNYQRDGFARITINKGRISYFPNSIGKRGCPFHQPGAARAFATVAEKVEGWKIRQRSPSFNDHFSQATLFWNSMSAWERQHIIDAFSFELNNVQTKEVRERVVNEMLVNVNSVLAQGVATNIGVEIKALNTTVDENKLTSPALSMDKPGTTIEGRKVAILVADGVRGDQVEKIKAALAAQNATGEVIAKTSTPVTTAEGGKLAVDRASPTAPSVIYDAVFVPGGRASVDFLKTRNKEINFVKEAYLHAKPIAALDEGVELLTVAQVDVNSPGVTTTPNSDLDAFANAFIESIKQHRFFNRISDSVPL